MCLKVHPDKNDHPLAERAFKGTFRESLLSITAIFFLRAELAEAFEILNDGDKRAFYDRTGSTDQT